MLLSFPSGRTTIMQGGAGGKPPEACLPLRAGEECRKSPALWSPGTEKIFPVIQGCCFCAGGWPVVRRESYSMTGRAVSR
ncbi:hypothetical protein, partial [Desulfovibrio sp.]|uniref:hypothetical protein n=1 Tax=Desulfovibrio sp. TaxID=885 RepID=UPI003FEF11EC